MSSGEPPRPRSVGAIVVGAGHNGLVAAAYLARAGLSVLVLEASDRLGGQAATETALGGAEVNICNCDHSMFRATPIMAELGLAKHGLRYIDLEPALTALPWDGGPAFFVFHDVQRTLEGLQATYPHDVAGYRRYVADAIPLARLVLDAANDVPTPGTTIPKALRRPRAMATMLAWQRQAVGDIARKYFGSEALRSALVTVGPAVWGLHPQTPNTGIGALGFAMRHAVRAGRPVGGSGALPRALAAALTAAGGEVRHGARVERLLVESRGTDRAVARGVRLVGGEEVLAPIVVSAIEPRTTILEWVGPKSIDTIGGRLPAKWSQLAAVYERAPEVDGYEAKVDAVIDGTVTYRQVDPALCVRLGIDPDRDVAGSTAVLSPPLAEMVAAHGDKQRGLVASRPMMLVQVPSALDRRVADALSPQQNVLSLEVLWTPWALRGGWVGSTEPKRWLELLDTLVDPSSGDSSVSARIVAQRLVGPVEYHERFAMPRGHSASFAGTPLTALLGRAPEQTRYRTPIDGLYLCGAGTFPGAGVWGASGRNVASVILRS